MIINQKKNILYKDRMSHERKSSVTKGQPSLNFNNNFNNTPLERASNEISFKGVPFRSRKLVKKIIDYGYKETEQLGYKSSIDFVKKHIGSAVERHLKKVLENNDLSQKIKVGTKHDTAIFQEKTFGHLLKNSIEYPFLKLPFHIVDSAINFLEKKNLIPKTEWGKAKGFYAKHRNALDDDDKLNSLLGILRTAEKYKYDPKKTQSASIFNDAMKMFDPQTGNYNGVHERALTRIVTGFIPAFFLANDAYNLSRLCDDDKKSADNEKKIRFNQETKRVMSNAYIQLITLGALSKFINSSKAAFVATTIVTVLFTEIYSRISNGKKIFFISKEEAKKMNAKEKEKLQKSQNDKQPQADVKTEVPQSSAMQTTELTPKIADKSKLGFKGSKVFTDFSMASNVSFTDNKQLETITDKNALTGKGLKPLLNGNTILAWVAGAITIGFAIKNIKKLKLNGTKIDRYFKEVEKTSQRFYDKLTKTENTFKREKFNEIANKLENYDSVLGKKFKTVTRKFQRSNAVEKNSDFFAKELEKLGHKDFAEKFRIIDRDAKGFLLTEAQEQIQKASDNEVIQKNFKFFYEQMSSNGRQRLADQIKEIILDNDQTINLKKYGKAAQILKRLAKADPQSDLKVFQSAFDNVFRVDRSAENIKTYCKALQELRNTNNKEVAKKIKAIIDAEVKSDTIQLGTKNKFFIKEMVDFVKEPFRFLWGTITLPYNLANKVVKMFEAPKQPKWNPEIKTVSNSLKKLSKIKATGEEFQKIVDKKINKAFNTSTMSNISNAELSSLAKSASTAATMGFLVTDNYNMVMLKSDGENKKDASLKAKERVVQETSRFFYQQLFINLFNNTFRNVYNSNLFGAQSINTVSTTIGEFFTRKAIGMPIKESTRQEILDKEYKNVTSKGAKGQFFRFMSRLTGKQVLSQREQTKKEVKKNP